MRGLFVSVSQMNVLSCIMNAFLNQNPFHKKIPHIFVGLFFSALDIFFLCSLIMWYYIDYLKIHFTYLICWYTTFPNKSIIIRLFDDLQCNNSDNKKSLDQLFFVQSSLYNYWSCDSLSNFMQYPENDVQLSTPWYILIGFISKETVC